MRAIVASLLMLTCSCSAACVKSNSSSASTASADEAADVPIACHPDALTKEQRARSAALATELSKGTTKRSDLPRGYSFELAKEGGLFEKAAEWISLERRCCPFLKFELGWKAGEDRAPTLAITGPEGTRDFLMEDFPAAK
jgi:hypothetical protein